MPIFLTGRQDFSLLPSDFSFQLHTTHTKNQTYCVKKYGMLSTVRHKAFTGFFILQTLLGFFQTPEKIELGSTFLHLKGLCLGQTHKMRERTTTFKGWNEEGQERQGLLASFIYLEAKRQWDSGALLWYSNCLKGMSSSPFLTVL